MRNAIDIGSVVVLSGVVGIVSQIDHGEGFAWVIWPSGCGLSDCQSAGNLREIASRDFIMEAVQALAPARQSLDQALFKALRSGASSTQIVEYEDDARPYYQRRIR